MRRHAIRFMIRTWTVHGLEGKHGILDLETEHVLLIVLPVARSLPQFGVEDVGSDDLLVATKTVLFLQRNAQICA